jgi:hypothetical protein
MNTQDHNQKKSSSQMRKEGNGRSNKFPEPRAWALRWDSQDYDYSPSPTTDQNDTAAQPKRGTFRESKFPQPRGWALRWDGGTISDIQDFYNPPPSSDADLETDGV